MRLTKQERIEITRYANMRDVIVKQLELLGTMDLPHNYDKASVIATAILKEFKVLEKKGN